MTLCEHLATVGRDKMGDFQYLYFIPYFALYFVERKKTLSHDAMKSAADTSVWFLKQI